MSPVEAVNVLKQASGKMSGLSVAECRMFDHALMTIEKYLLAEKVVDQHVNASAEMAAKQERP